MINPKQLRELVIRPTLRYLDPEIPYSEDAVELLMMTAAHESHLGTYIAQIGGPALGIYQMEDSTHDDINDEDNIHDNYLIYKKDIDKKVDALYIRALTDEQNLIMNFAYATAMARVHYYRVKGKLPSKDNIEAMAEYAKKWYNTEKGKATWEDYANAYKERCM